MLCHWLSLICIGAAALCAQDTKPDRAALRADLEPALNFEALPSGDTPGGWSGGPPGTIFAETKIVHGGRGAARIERTAASANEFSSITKSIPIDFSGSTIELRGYLRTEDVSGFAGLWMREDGDTPTLAFDNMGNRQLKGTTDWASYSIKLPLVAEASKLFIGVLVLGTGKAWADDLELLVDGKPVWDLPQGKPPETTVIGRDHQFDKGSGIVVPQLSSAQIENLTTLGKVWGFLKYHHPKVTSGEHHWDYDLFRVVPSILAASDRTAANAIFVHWIDDLGPITPCNPCAKLEAGKDLNVTPDLGWISDRSALGPELSQRLRAIYENRAPNQQFFVSMAPKIGNPVFKHELEYSDVKLPDFGFQLLALYRFWNIVEYWSPNRDIIGEYWNRVLTDFIPRVSLAKDDDSYKRELMALITRLHDGHANLWNALDARPPVGKCQIPVNLRFVENAPVITGFTVASDPPADLKVGDVITELDGVPAHQLIESWLPYYAGSNDAARMRDIGYFFTRGDCGDAAVGIRRQNTDLKVTVKRSAPSHVDRAKHDLPGPTFRLLSKDVAYLKLSTVKADDCPHYVEQAAGTKGLIIDIRNYPSEFVVFALGQLLVSVDTPFALFTEGDLSNPGAFHWGDRESLSPQKPHYSGKIIVLVDESSLSQAEYTAMAFRSALGAIVVGSTTSGADGNVSPFTLPGGLHTMISGLGVFYPDKKPTQRIGIKADVDAKPTIAGIRAGRDEVLEQAIRQIVGEKVPLEEIEKLAKHEGP